MNLKRFVNILRVRLHLEAINYHIADSQLEKFYCPTCATRLRLIDSADPWTRRLICEKEHKLFIPIKGSLSNFPSKVASTALPASIDNSSRAIIQLWFNVPKYRKRLAEQLAMIIRRIYENSVYAYEDLPEEFIFCPICKDSLEGFDNNDVWTKGLICKNGHRYAARGGALGFRYLKCFYSLHIEMSSKPLMGLINGWLADETGYLSGNLHPSIKNILFEALETDKQRINKL